jgi:hypothetical protein
MMNKPDKQQFIRDLVASVQRTVLEAVDHMPEEWDGIELRQYLADKFVDSTFNMNARRKRDYRNTVAVTMGL